MSSGAPMFKHILVPLDGSSFGEAALPAAVALARRSAGQLRLVTVRDSSGDPVTGGGVPWERDYLSRTGRGRGWFEAPVSTVLREGPVPDEILKEAASWRADLV